MPPYQKLYIVLGSGVAISAVVTVLPFDFVYVTLFLFVCGWIGGRMLVKKSYKSWMNVVGIGVVALIFQLGYIHFEQEKIHALEGMSMNGMARIIEVQEKENRQDVVVEFEKNGERLLATVFGKELVEEGSRVSAYCEVDRIENYNGIPFEKIKAAHQIFGGCKKFAWSVVETNSWKYQIIQYKRRMGAYLEEPLTKENGFLLRGMVFGDDARISKTAKEDFKKSGISHILAVSGFNIALFGVWGLAGLMSLGVHRKIASIVVMIGIGLFVVMVGMGASVVRAAIMGCIPLLGSLLERATITRHIFLVTVMGMIVWQPYSLWYDVGFQLSVAATAGLLFLPPLLKQKILWTRPIPEIIMQTIAATFATAPILLWHFKTVSLLGLLTNILVALPVVQIMGIAVIRIMMSGLRIGDEQLAWLQDRLLEFLYKTGEIIARYDWVALNSTMGIAVVVFVGLLMGVKWGMKRKRNTIIINNETWYIITI